MASKKIMTNKEKFKRYERVRQSGVINMFDLANGTKLSGLSKEDYLDVMKHYSEYRAEFVEDNENAGKFS